MDPLRILITGASDGIGKAMAIAFAKRGAALGLMARRVDALSAVQAECRSAGSPRVEIEAVDVTDFENSAPAIDRLDEKLGGVSHFIANAGISGRSRPTANAWPEAKKCLDVNLYAAIHGMERMKERMVKRGSGVLVGVSSVAGTRGLPDSGAYSASKAALTAYLESCRVDLRGYGIQVITIAPGYIETALTQKNRGKMPFIITADKAAEIFVSGIIRGKKVIVAPWQYEIAIRALRVMPIFIYDRIMGSAIQSIRKSE